MHKTELRLVTLLTGILLISACHYRLQTDTPIRSHYYYSDAGNAQTLIVLLPGIYDSPSQFEHHGFIRAARSSGLAADLVAVDAHIGYYEAGTIIERLRQDIIAPAIAKGYREIWLVGISLGGYGAIIYTSSHENDVSGILLLAPYLAREELMEGFAATGKLDQLDTAPLNEHEKQIWGWLENYSANRPQTPRLYLGYGESDKFAASHRLLATGLQPGQVMTTNGGHNWDTWRTLWRKFLGRGMLSASHDASPGRPEESRVAGQKPD
jgi:pimeloyl-ACP methyl ester carboxylesterase